MWIVHPAVVPPLVCWRATGAPPPVVGVPALPLTAATMGIMVASIVPSSAAAALSLLEEPESELQSHALRSLNVLADVFWPEISSAVPKIQEMSEDSSFVDKSLAALVAAKVLFHLGELDEALVYALSAGDKFDVAAGTEFAKTLRARCIDDYIEQMAAEEAESTAAAATAATMGNGIAEESVLPRKELQSEMKAVFERVVDECITNGRVREAIGVSLDARRLDCVEAAITRGCKEPQERADALAYCFSCAQRLLSSRSFRKRVLRLVADLHRKEAVPREVVIADCLAHLSDAGGVAEALVRLVTPSSDTESSTDADTQRELIALQICFDIVDNDHPHFAIRVASLLPQPQPQPAAPASALPAIRESETPEGADDGPAAMAVDSAAVVANGDPPAPASPDARQLLDSKLNKLRTVLSGTTSSALALHFLCSLNGADTYALRKVKSSLDSRSSVGHSALVFANALAHAGTAIDGFLRANLDWLRRATAWAKFSATACLGVIHARHSTAAVRLLSPYLPPAGGPAPPVGGAGPTSASSSSYSEGGALYALGLIAATSGRAAPLGPNRESGGAYLLAALRSAMGSPVVEHGACLGLGLASMASWDGDSASEEYDALCETLAGDDAVAGEASALGIGLLGLGSGSELAVNTLLAQARETAHEKLGRGCALGLALLSYGREEAAEGLIDTMSAESDASIRYGAQYAVGLAYCGTGDNRALRRLLNAAVADVNNDVRRAAVLCLGFVLFRRPESVPSTTALLAESCHAHVRYGAAMALGIGCVGTGLPAAVRMLERLSGDSVDFVRQGALLGLALVLMHHSEARSAAAGSARRLFARTAADKHEDVLTKFGAVIAGGLIDAAGRNGVIALVSPAGHVRMSAVVGLTLFTQYWHWFPLVHCIGLSLRPAALTALDASLRMPKMDGEVGATTGGETSSKESPMCLMTAPRGMFAYPPSGPPETAKVDTPAPAAVLSITLKARSREARKARTKSAAAAAAAASTPTAKDGESGSATAAEESGDVDMVVESGTVDTSATPTTDGPATRTRSRAKTTGGDASGEDTPKKSDAKDGAADSDSAMADGEADDKKSLAKKGKKKSVKISEDGKATGDGEGASAASGETSTPVAPSVETLPLRNPSRVLPGQEGYLRWASPRWRSVSPSVADRFTGVVMVRDAAEDKSTPQYVELIGAAAAAAAAGEPPVGAAAAAVVASSSVPATPQQPPAPPAPSSNAEEAAQTPPPPPPAADSSEPPAES